MKTYALALESGPKRKKTYVHVIEPLGCCHRGDTTDEAIDITPDEIREFLRFLQRHGESVDPDEPIELDVVQHITEGTFLGNGTLFIEADHEPLTEAEVEAGARRIGWMGEDTIACVRPIMESEPERWLGDGPEDSKRPIRRIVQHIIGAEAAYLATIIKGMKDVNATARDADREDADLLDLLARQHALISERLLAMTAEERAATRMAGANRVTARRMLRRMLEHHWEHWREIERRIR